MQTPARQDREIQSQTSDLPLCPFGGSIDTGGIPLQRRRPVRRCRRRDPRPARCRQAARGNGPASHFSPALKQDANRAHGTGKSLCPARHPAPHAPRLHPNFPQGPIDSPSVAPAPYTLAARPAGFPAAKRNSVAGNSRRTSHARQHRSKSGAAWEPDAVTCTSPPIFKFEFFSRNNCWITSSDSSYFPSPKWW